MLSRLRHLCPGLDLSLAGSQHGRKFKQHASPFILVLAHTFLSYNTQVHPLPHIDRLVFALVKPRSSNVALTVYIPLNIVLNPSPPTPRPMFTNITIATPLGSGPTIPRSCGCIGLLGRKLGQRPRRLSWPCLVSSSTP